MLDYLLEAMVIDPHHDRPVHLYEPPVRIPGEAGIIRRGGKALDRAVGQAQVQDRVHHSRHRYPCAGADRNQQRMRLVAEFQAHRFLHRGKRIVDLRLQFRRIVPVIVVERRADVGGDGETRRDRQADRGHLGQIRPFASQQVAHIRSALILAGAKPVNPLGHADLI